MVFVVDKVALGQVFCEFFGFPMSISIHLGSPYPYITWGMNNRSTGGRSSDSYPSDMFMIIMIMIVIIIKWILTTVQLIEFRGPAAMEFRGPCYKKLHQPAK
jgi:hypothetical protein